MNTLDFLFWHAMDKHEKNKYGYEKIKLKGQKYYFDSFTFLEVVLSGSIQGCTYPLLY
jgi:hypothetical protein